MNGVSILCSEDNMSAVMTITKYKDTGIPDVDALLDEVEQLGIVNGVSHKRIHTLYNLSIAAKDDNSVSDIIAKGLPPRRGKDSSIKPLVPNALERVLTPQCVGQDKVDMRNLGDIICVAAQTNLAQRIAPSKGRSGWTIMGEKIESMPGEWQDIILGDNTRVSPTDKNIIVSTVAGQPKFANNIMTIDPTFTAPKGVNVGTGNIKYEGAVIVNGDITDNMRVIATGDITVNGFVESAYLRSGGDIIITEGATGKAQYEDCQLIALGSIYIQHAQGLDIVAGKHVNVAKQLAHSRVTATGSITVGDIDNPKGNLFACTLKCGGSVRAGTLGAISGSVLSIDFSTGYTALSDRHNALQSLYDQLCASTANQAVKMAQIRNKHVPGTLTHKITMLNNSIDAQKTLLNWLQDALEQAQRLKQEYENKVSVIANKELFPGVSVILNTHRWQGKQEYRQCQVLFENDSWQCIPTLS